MIRFQVKRIVKCMKTKISEAIVAAIQDQIPAIKYISFDDIKILASDFASVQMPAIQIIDLQSEHRHEQGRSKWAWRLTVEILLKSNEWDQVSQQDLWNLEYIVKRALFKVPNLGIPGVIQLNLLGGATDLHVIKPFYFARMDLQVDFYEDAVRAC